MGHRIAGFAAAACAAWAAFPGAVRAGDPVPFSARAGESLAREAALAWTDDAQLVWVENDEPVSDAGAAARWGYLFYSPSRDASRGYTVRDGKIRQANDLRFDFPAPPVEGEWVDSGDALAAAEAKAGAKYRAEEGGRIHSMLLVRGMLDVKHPDAATWAVVYDSETAPGLWIVVDATSGKVVRTWRG